MEFKLWHPWLNRVPRIRRQFADALDGDDPLLHNETASVGVLAGAATRIGYLALAEYSSQKRGSGRGRPYRRGRCDLWISTPGGDRSWSFEVKQILCRGGIREATLEDAPAPASKDAKAVNAFGADRHYGALLFTAAEGHRLDPVTVLRKLPDGPSPSASKTNDSRLG
ncbi:hypothetical protein METY_1344 [Methylopila sp. Yamaguchi]|nr:hypothetical protein METY_1344 [Methylopila sp. Yamaguchi]